MTGPELERGESIDEFFTTRVERDRDWRAFMTGRNVKSFKVGFRLPRRTPTSVIR
jgi:hypothetical protein